MTATMTQQLEMQISLLRSELSELRQQITPLSAGLRVPVHSLAPEPFEILSPIELIIRPTGDGFIATFFDANVNASGDTETEAFENLKDMIVATFSEYTNVGVDRLGPEPTRQFAVLRKFVRAQK